MCIVLYQNKLLSFLVTRKYYNLPTYLWRLGIKTIFITVCNIQYVIRYERIILNDSFIGVLKLGISNLN